MAESSKICLHWIKQTLDKTFINGSTKKNVPGRVNGKNKESLYLKIKFSSEKIIINSCENKKMFMRLKMIVNKKCIENFLNTNVHFLYENTIFESKYAIKN